MPPHDQLAVANIEKIDDEFWFGITDFGALNEVHVLDENGVELAVYQSGLFPGDFARWNLCSSTTNGDVNLDNDDISTNGNDLVFTYNEASNQYKVTQDTDGNLTLGAGGILTEILSDTSSLLLPSSEDDVLECFEKLKISKIAKGYRGFSGVDVNQIVDAIMKIQEFVLDSKDKVFEIEINPLIVTSSEVIVADALIRKVT